MNNLPENNIPWYKQFWPWFLLFLPLTVVIAGIITFIIAQGNPPALVSSDYYKEGLAINASKQLEENAKKLGLTATVTINNTTITVKLNNSKSQPSELLVELRHATLEQYDQILNLVKITDSIYQTPFKLPKQGKWYISIKDRSKAWEIKKTAILNNE